MAVVAVAVVGGSLGTPGSDSVTIRTAALWVSQKVGGRLQENGEVWDVVSMKPRSEVGRDEAALAGKISQR